MTSDATTDDSASAHVSHQLNVQCWGDFAITDGLTGTDLKPRGRKARALIAFLALHPDKPVSRERIAGLLWGDRGEDQARASLRQVVFELGGLTREPYRLISVTRGHIVLNSATLMTDIDMMKTCANDYALLLTSIPDADGLLFANLNGIASDYDEWLAIERTRQYDVLTALVSDGSVNALAAGQSKIARALHLRLLEYAPDDPSPQPATKYPEQPAKIPVAKASDPSSKRNDRRIAAIIAVPLVAGMVVLATWKLKTEASMTPTTIAVLPFKDMSGGGQRQFAEGLSEEILGQLARNRRLKVMGRTSAWSFEGMKLDAPTLGRKLDVEYLVEGSVRSADKVVRIDVALVRVKDGTQLWSERYSGLLDNVFAIQDKIGTAVARRLDLGDLAQAAANPTRVTRGDVYSLYLTARSLIRDREEAKLDVAIDLLHRAVDLDPKYARAWASLAIAVKHRMQLYRPNSEMADRREALSYVRRALFLDPHLPDAHLALALVLDFTPKARALYEQAARLNPHSAETWIELEKLYARAGDFPRMLDAARRAVAVDPLMRRAAYTAAYDAWSMGHPEEAATYLRRIGTDGTPQPLSAHEAKAALAAQRGDIAGAIREEMAAYAIGDQGGRRRVEDDLFGLVYALRYLPEARRLSHFVKVDDVIYGMWQGRPPPPAYVRTLYTMPVGDWKDSERLYLALCTLLKAGRTAEAVTLYDRRYQSPEDMQARHTNNAYLNFAPLFAIALRDFGRNAEADRLVALAMARVRDAKQRGPMPLWFRSKIPRLLAVSGDRAGALAELEHCVALGWAYPTDGFALPDIADEPAFQSLRGDPRFERLRARSAEYIDRERRKLGPISSI